MPLAKPLRFTAANVLANPVAQCHRAMQGDRIDPVDWFLPRLEWCVSAEDTTSFCTGDSGAGLYTVATVKGVRTAIVHGILSVCEGPFFFLYSFLFRFPVWLLHGYGSVRVGQVGDCCRGGRGTCPWDPWRVPCGGAY